MTRPLAVVGFSYAAALVTAFIIGIEYTVFMCMIAVIMGVLSLLSGTLRKDRTIVTVCFSAAAAFILLYGYQTAYITPCDTLYGEELTVTGKLCDLPYKQYDRYYYKLSLESAEPYRYINGANIVISSKYPQNVNLYDTVTAHVHINEKSEGTLRYHQLAQGIQLRGYLMTGEAFDVSDGNEKPPYYYALAVKRYLCNVTERNLSAPDAALIKAVLLGDKTAMTPEQKTLFAKAGVTDLLCVSGLHLSVMTSMVLIILNLLTGKKNRLAAGICTFFVFAYMAIVGFPPSVVRAGVMQILLLLSQAIIQKADSINSLGLSVLLICFLNPYSAVDVSFLLSLSATLGIILVGVRVTGTINNYLLRRIKGKELYNTIYGKLLRKVTSAVISMIIISIAAVIFTAPVLIIYFKSLAVYGIMFHLLVSYAVVILLIISPIFLLLCALGGGAAAYPLKQVIIVIASYINGTTGLVSHLPSPVIYLAKEYVPICLIISGASVIVFFLLTRKRIAACLSVITAVVVFSTGGIIDYCTNAESIKLSVLDTGEGLSVILSEDDKTAVLFCGGSYDKSTVMDDYIELSSAKDISFMLLLDKKNSCSAYADTLLREYAVGNIEVCNPDSFKNSIQEYFSSDTSLMHNEPGKQCLVHWKNTDIYSFKSGYGGAVRLEMHGVRLLILADKTDCSLLPEEWKQTDYLIINGKSKNNISIHAGTVIVSDTAGNVAGDLQNYNLSESKLYCTAGKGNLAVRVYPEGTQVIRREKDWQS